MGTWFSCLTIHFPQMVMFSYYVSCHRISSAWSWRDSISWTSRCIPVSPTQQEHRPRGHRTSRRPRCVVFSPETVEQAQQVKWLAGFCGWTSWERSVKLSNLVKVSRKVRWRHQKIHLFVRIFRILICWALFQLNKYQTWNLDVQIVTALPSGTHSLVRHSALGAIFFRLWEP